MHLLVQVLVHEKKCAMLVTNTEGLAIFITSWLWQRFPGSDAEKEAVLGRLYVFFRPYDTCHVTFLNSKTRMLETEPCQTDLSEIRHIVVDEAHHCCCSTEQLDRIMTHAHQETKLLLCSDLSQSLGVPVATPPETQEVFLDCQSACNSQHSC